MTTFKQFLNESFKNFFTLEDKKRWAQEAYDQLVKSYQKIGGLKGKEFESVETFLNSDLFWKLNIINGKIIAAAYYKDKNGRKRVAISSDGSEKGKQIVADIMVSDLLLGRSWAEQSSNSLSFLIKEVGIPFVKKYILTPVEVEKLTGDEIRTPPENDLEITKHPELRSFFYQRKIGNEWKTKLALGTAKKIFCPYGLTGKGNILLKCSM